MTRGFYQRRNLLTCLLVPGWEEEGVVAAFSTRRGGVSAYPYHTLNLGLHVGDDPDLVRKNRGLFVAAAGIQGTPCCAEQVHGSRVRRVGRESRGAGYYDYATSLAATDALVTDEPGVPLMAFFADCVPVYLFDPGQRAIGLAHSGWKGTVARIGARTVETMAREFKSSPERILAFIGPGIGPCCYMVDEKVAELFRKEFAQHGQFLYSKKQEQLYHLDLKTAIKLTLTAAGLREENIQDAGVCTCCRRDLYFSYRGEHGTCGRMGAVIELR